MAQLVWHEWFPTIWLDQHQMSASGARIFVMPATDPINPNVHPVIYRWNSVLGSRRRRRSKPPARTASSTTRRTNLWQGAMAWSGWWHNQIGLSPRSPAFALPRRWISSATSRLSFPLDRVSGDGPEPISTRHRLLRRPTPCRALNHPRPWMGGHWTPVTSWTTS